MSQRHNQASSEACCGNSVASTEGAVRVKAVTKNCVDQSVGSENCTRCAGPSCSQREASAVQTETSKSESSTRCTLRPTRRCPVALRTTSAIKTSVGIIGSLRTTRKPLHQPRRCLANCSARATLVFVRLQPLPARSPHVFPSTQANSAPRRGHPAQASTAWRASHLLPTVAHSLPLGHAARVRAARLERRCHSFRDHNGSRSRPWRKNLQEPEPLWQRRTTPRRRHV